MIRARTRARKRALDILFESEARGDDPLEVLAQRRETDDAPPVSGRQLDGHDAMLQGP